jgi:hypothetical protein
MPRASTARSSTSARTPTATRSARSARSSPISCRATSSSTGTAIPTTAATAWAFDKIEALGWRAELTAADGVREICAALAAGTTAKTARTLTLDWYRELSKWRAILRDVETYGGIVEL